MMNMNYYCNNYVYFTYDFYLHYENELEVNSSHILLYISLEIISDSLKVMTEGDWDFRHKDYFREPGQ
jgi:hypothetical protein